MFLSQKSSNVSSDIDLELEPNKSLTETETLHCLQMIRNYLTSFSDEMTDANYNSLHNIKKRIAGSTSMNKKTLVHQYLMSQ